MRLNQTLALLLAGALLAACTANARFDVSGNQIDPKTSTNAQLDPRPTATTPSSSSNAVPPMDGTPAEAPAYPRSPRDTAGWSAMQGSSENASPSQVHVVRLGDTLHAIAQRHGVTVPMLYTANGLLNDRLTPGQHIVIPNAR